MKYKNQYITNSELQKLAGINDEYHYRKLAHTIIADIPFEVLEKIFVFSKELYGGLSFIDTHDPFPNDIIYHAALKTPPPEQ